MTIIRSIRANVYIFIPCNEVFLWNATIFLKIFIYFRSFTSYIILPIIGYNNRILNIVKHNGIALRSKKDFVAWYEYIYVSSYRPDDGHVIDRNM